MAQHTITEARQRVTEMSPQLNPEVWAQLDGEVKQAERAATAKAHTFVAERFTEASLTGNEAVAAICDVRDRANALVAAAKAGHMSAAEANEQLNDLRAEYRRLERDATNVSRTADLVEAIEDDPIGWADNLHARFPATQPHFTF